MKPTKITVRGPLGSATLVAASTSTASPSASLMRVECPDCLQRRGGRRRYIPKYSEIAPSEPRRKPGQPQEPGRVRQRGLAGLEAHGWPAPLNLTGLRTPQRAVADAVASADAQDLVVDGRRRRDQAGLRREVAEAEAERAEGQLLPRLAKRRRLGRAQRDRAVGQHLHRVAGLGGVGELDWGGVGAPGGAEGERDRRDQRCE